MSNVVEILVKGKDLTKDAFGSAEKGATSFGDKMKSVNRVAVGASLAIGAGLLKVGADSIETSRRMGELDAKASAVFEGSLGSVEAWAEKNKKAFGTSSREVVGLAASFADLVKPMGFTAEQAADMATKTLDLSGALAKWSGGQYEAAEVSEVLSKAMLGETDGLKALGISISQADIQARLAKNGQDKLTGAALQQAEALATQELIMEKSTDAQKAWADGGRDAAIAEGSLSSALATTQETVAQLLTPAIEKGTQALAAFAGWAQNNQGTVMVLGGALAGLAATVLVVNAAVKAYTAVTKVVTVVTKAYTLAMKALNLVMRMNPLGLVVTAVMLLVGALVLAYKKSDTFRRIVDGAFRAVQKGASFAFGWVKENWPLLLAILTGPFAPAVIVIAKNKDKILGFFKAIPGKIKGFFSGLAGFISAPFEAAFNAIKWLWNSTVGGFGFNFGGWDPPGPGSVPGVSFTIPEMAHGGIAGGLISVGERGRELIRVPHGSTVIPNGQTEAMLGGGGRGGRMVLELRSSGSKVDNLLVELLRGAIRAKGGNVQVVLGQAGR